jgi:hypothetical protein
MSTPAPLNPERKYVLVETVHQFRQRYVVELGVNEPTEWALDSVVCEDVKVLSSVRLGETLVSHRVLAGGLAEAVALAKEDDAALADWSEDKVVEHHVGMKSEG